MEDEIIRVLIADDNKLLCEMLEQSFGAAPGFAVMGVAYDGLEAVRMTQRILPDLLVLDIMMPHLDGLGVLERLRECQLEKTPHIIVLTGMGQEAVATLALSLGADYYMLKPFDMDILVKRARDLIGCRSGTLGSAAPQHRDQMVVSLLAQINMPPNINGYHYLREAARLVLADVSLLCAITNKLYPMLAATFDSTASRVERSIRHAIETTASKGNMDVLYQLSGNTTDVQKAKPTNGEFIAMLAEYVRAGA